MKCYAIALLIFASIISLTLGASLPRSEDDWVKIRRTCYNLLRASPEVRERVDRKQYDDEPETHCLIRMEAAAALAKGKDGFEEYRAAFETCAAGVTPEEYGDDYCKKSFRLFTCSWAAWRKHIKKVE
ncbi:hypothetical protein pipiens_015588 [Culex pipiens pipiens]|uniref:Uncharacterized protein n=1 Tax=Culex pipiens pipiens TaxID=38569 RepID=A0ABD1CPT6_CULPP